VSEIAAPSSFYAALQDAQLLVRPVELIDVTDATHAETPAIALRQVTQRRVEAARAEEEAGVQHLAVAQLPAQAAREARATRVIGQVGRDPFAIG